MTPDQVISGMNIAALVGAIVSVILALVAIGLSAYFYRMSNSITESTRNAANKIESGVEQMKNLMDTLYRDTFSLHKNTHSALLEHAWTGNSSESRTLTEEVSKQADERVDDMKKAINEEIAKTLKDRNLEIDDRLAKLEEMFSNSVDEARKTDSEVLSRIIKNFLIEYFNRKLNSTGFSRTKYPLRSLIKFTLENVECDSINPILVTLDEMDQQGIIKMERDVPYADASVTIDIEKVTELSGVL